MMKGSQTKNCDNTPMSLQLVTRASSTHTHTNAIIMLLHLPRAPPHATHVAAPVSCHSRVVTHPTGCETTGRANTQLRKGRVGPKHEADGDMCVAEMRKQKHLWVAGAENDCVARAGSQRIERIGRRGRANC